VRGAALLGLRLAGASAGPARLRAGLMALATTIGTLLMLTIVAIAHAEQLRDDTLYTSPEMRRLLAAIVLSVALPVLVLVATAGRLSAQLRDRRLGNLRLLGLTPLQTRTVAAVEAATAAVIGLLVGRLLFVAVRLLLPLVHIAGRHWRSASLLPSLAQQVLVLAGVLLAVLAVAAIPSDSPLRPHWPEPDAPAPSAPRFCGRCPCWSGSPCAGSSSRALGRTTLLLTP
jgi:putative ABC transport system permease protein